MEGLWFICGYFAGVSCAFLITAGVMKFYGVELRFIPSVKKGEK